MSFTTSVGSGVCGHLDADGLPNFFPLTCGGLYFGGANVGVPLPSKVPDQGSSIVKASCTGTTVTLTGASPSEAGGNRCTRGASSKFGTSCLTDAECASTCVTTADCTPGATTCNAGVCNNAKCAQTKCTNAGCLFGPPLPIPNSSHSGAATSTCVINTATANATGTSDCSTGSVSGLTLPLSSGTFLAGDLMAMRCSGGSTPGANCTGGGGCGTIAAGSCPGGTCVNDTGRCAPGFGEAPNTPCCQDSECAFSGTCETGSCVGGANGGFACITDADCPASTCKTFIQPCPICDPATGKCDAGINNGLACTQGDSAIDGDYPTSHDCPPPPSSGLGALPIAFSLDSGTVRKTAVNLTDQPNVFCSYCKNKNLNSFARRCGGTPTGTVCTGNTGTTSPPCNAAAPCLPIPCTGNATCSGQTQSPGFTSCGQRTSGAFTATNVARTIVEIGSPAGPLTTGGPEKPATLVSIFCIPLTFSSLVDTAADLPGPGAVAIQGMTQSLP